MAWVREAVSVLPSQVPYVYVPTQVARILLRTQNALAVLQTANANIVVMGGVRGVKTETMGGKGRQKLKALKEEYDALREYQMVRFGKDNGVKGERQGIRWLYLYLAESSTT